MSKTVVIGLTGTTGAGKSEVSRLLKARGAVIVDADVLARRAVEPGTPALAALAERFSASILHEDGTLDRAALARVAFASKEATEAMNAIVHPAVIAMMKDEIDTARAHGARLIVLDVPLLFQSGTDALCDTTVAVTADEAVRRRRICERDGLTAEQAAARMQAQPAEAYYTERAAHVIENNGELPMLEAAVKAFCKEALV